MVELIKVDKLEKLPVDKMACGFSTKNPCFFIHGTDCSVACGLITEFKLHQLIQDDCSRKPSCKKFNKFYPDL